MRRLLFFLLLWPAIGSAQTEGIYNFGGTFEEAQASAQTEGKDIFVLAAPIWFSGRHKLLKEVFGQEQVKARYQEQFINLVMTGEDMASGPWFRRWRVRAYPTLLFLKADGTEITRHLGMVDAAIALDLAQAAADKL
jgi:hypothetical protein